MQQVLANDNFDATGYESLRLTIQDCIDGKIACDPAVLPILFAELKAIRTPQPPKPLQRVFAPANDVRPVLPHKIGRVAIFGVV